MPSLWSQVDNQGRSRASLRQMWKWFHWRDQDLGGHYRTRGTWQVWSLAQLYSVWDFCNQGSVSVKVVVFKNTKSRFSSFDMALGHPPTCLTVSLNHQSSGSNAQELLEKIEVNNKNLPDKGSMFCPPSKSKDLKKKPEKIELVARNGPWPQ